MLNIFQNIKKSILGDDASSDGQRSLSKDGHVDNLIALGVLLWVVAQADEKFLSSEEQKIKAILREYSRIKEDDMPIVLRSIEEAAMARIDLHSFAREVTPNLTREHKIAIIENLFRVGCADNELDELEHEIIRTIANLFRLDHKEFIHAKIKVKKEFGMEVH